MIKFFRHIRKSLLQQNKMGKYFTYAIGEILLVVIGILIALQINNWNEQRKLRINEISILEQLNSDLKKNFEEIEEVKANMVSSAKGCLQLLEFLNSKNNSIDSLSNWLSEMDRNPIFNNANTAYKNIENSSNSVLSNDSLRLRITLMYEKEFRNIDERDHFFKTDRLPEFRKQHRANFTLTTQLSKDGKETYYNYDKPKNVSNLKQNDSFKNALIDVYNFRKLRIRFLDLTLQRLQSLIRDIDSEIETLK